jgi:hypothetical protein
MSWGRSVSLKPGAAASNGRSPTSSPGDDAYQAEQLDQRIAAAPPPSAAEPSLVDKLTDLAKLHDSGALRSAEYEAAKAKVLA